MNNDDLFETIGKEKKLTKAEGLIEQIEDVDNIKRQLKGKFDTAGDDTKVVLVIGCVGVTVHGNSKILTNQEAIRMAKWILEMLE